MSFLKYGNEDCVIQGAIVVGRGSGCHLRLTDPKASRKHLMVWPEGDGDFAMDLESGNGTSINGVRLSTKTPQRLNPGDLIQVGTAVVAYHEGHPMQMTLHVPASLLEAESDLVTMGGTGQDAGQVASLRPAADHVASKTVADQPTPPIIRTQGR